MNTLAGLKIVVTRPREQSQQLASSIVQLGGQALIFPLLNISAAPDQALLQQQMQRLNEFNLAIFISPNAVHYGMAAITQIPKQLRFAAVGAGTAKALQSHDISTVLTPQQRFDSEGLLALDELQNVTGQKIIIFRGETGRELLGDTLKQRGAHIEYASCYQRSKPDWHIEQLIAQQPDAITITSSEAITYLSNMLGTHTALQALPLFVIHPRIAETAQQQGWQQVELTESGDTGLLNAVQNWATRKTKDKHHD